MPKIGRKIK